MLSGDADPNNLNTYSYSYQPPSNNYLPSAVHFSSTSAPVYQSFNYGPPAPYYNPIPNNVKFELHSYPQQYELIHPYQFLFTKLKAKLNIFTIGKLLLKLLIFKKIIKFIGIICLLLILPKLKHFVKDMSATTSIESTEIESRQFPLIESGTLNIGISIRINYNYLIFLLFSLFIDILEQRINEVFNFAIEALQKF